MYKHSSTSSLKTIDSDFTTESSAVSESQAANADGAKTDHSQSVPSIDEQLVHTTEFRKANTGKVFFISCVSGLLSFCYWASSLPAGVAKVKLPAIFSDNMVLQRDQVTKIRGTATPGIDVAVKLNEQTVLTRAGLDGAWVANLAALPPGGPYTIDIDAGEHVTIRNILAGDVWLCSGQSNMARQMSVCSHEKSDIEKAFPQLRVFTIPECASDKPLRYGQGEWLGASPQTIPNFSACEFYLARELQTKTKMPIGIVSCCAGGKPLNVWLSNPNGKDKNEGPFVTASVYRAMVAPILGYGVKGMIWYQGESDIFKPAHYRKNLPKMLNDLRNRWKFADMPLIIVQLPNYAEHDRQPSESLWAEVREVQTEVSRELKNAYLICTYDSAREIPVTLHPPDKRLIAHRVAETAIAITAQPTFRRNENSYYQSLKVDGKDAIVHFDQNAEPLDTKKSVVSGFALAGSDKKFYWATAKVQADGFTVRVSCPEVPSPTAVRYAWADNPVADLYTDSGMPVVPFRSDSYKADPSAYNMRGRFNFWNDMGQAQQALVKKQSTPGSK